MSATDELLRLLDEFERDLCHAGCGAKCGTHEERRALIDGVKDRYAQAITATLGGGECEITPIAPGSDMGRCSACGEIADTASNYCWKCGAKAVKR